MAYRQGETDAYPGKKPKKTKPIKQTQFLIVEWILENLKKKHQHILLEQRPSPGIWGGLWCFPELPEGMDAGDYCQQHYGMISAAEQLPPFRHTFSHYHLEIQPVYLQLQRRHHRVADDRLAWCSPAQWRQLGLPAPVKKLLETLGPVK